MKDKLLILIACILLSCGANITESDGGVEDDDTSTYSYTDSGSTDTVVDSETGSEEDAGGSEGDGGDTETDDTGSGTEDSDDTETESGSGQDGGIDSGVDSGTDTGTGTDSNTETDTGSETGSDTGSETESESESDTESETESESETDTGSDTETETETESETDTSTGTIEKCVSSTWKCEDNNLYVCMWEEWSLNQECSDLQTCDEVVKTCYTTEPLEIIDPYPIENCLDFLWRGICHEKKHYYLITACYQDPPQRGYNTGKAEYEGTCEGACYIGPDENPTCSE